MQQHLELLIVLAVLSIALVGTFIFKQAKKEKTDSQKNGREEPKLGDLNALYDDGVISVRKTVREPAPSTNTDPSSLAINEGCDAKSIAGKVLILHVMAKPEQAFAGYDLLQALLSQGLRFGEMSIFHRYQQINGKGPVLFSLASATEPGTFDIHHMGRFSCLGLTLFLKTSGTLASDLERLELMLNTARRLAKELDGNVYDHDRQLLTDAIIEAYRNSIQPTKVNVEIEAAST